MKWFLENYCSFWKEFNLTEFNTESAKQIVADGSLILFYHYFSEKIRLGISCE